MKYKPSEISVFALNEVYFESQATASSYVSILI